MRLNDITDTIEKALSAVGMDTKSGVSRTTLDTIRQALDGARPMPVETPAVVPEAPARAPAAPGRFDSLGFANAHGRRAFKLYVPSSYDGTVAMPLVVMLHGCQQDPDDFARGTRMNEVAEEAGCLVAYPAQSRKANGSNCWRWFDAKQQQRDSAEPSIIAGIVRHIGQSVRVDERRVFAAGLSAGAAMAVILGETYPELFAAIAAHSGLPRGAAHDVPSAFAAMHGTPAQSAPSPLPSPARAVPTIVFHGLADATVVPANGNAIVQRAVAALSAERGALQEVGERQVANGLPCTRTLHLDRDGVPVVEHWAVGNAGHAWFGGSSAGSYALPHGPDASREMMRFFYAQR